MNNNCASVFPALSQPDKVSNTAAPTLSKFRCNISICWNGQFAHKKEFSLMNTPKNSPAALDLACNYSFEPIFTETTQHLFSDLRS